MGAEGCGGRGPEHDQSYTEPLQVRPKTNLAFLECS